MCTHAKSGIIKPRINPTLLVAHLEPKCTMPSLTLLGSQLYDTNEAIFVLSCSAEIPIDLVVVFTGGQLLKLFLCLPTWPMKESRRLTKQNT